MKTFRELTVWQQTHQLVIAVYRATDHFPDEERYGLVSQMRRASVSVAANIVEGHKRRSQKEFLQFLHIADSSLEELKYYLLLSQDLGYLRTAPFEQLHQHAEAIGRMLTSFKKHIRKEVPDAHMPAMAVSGT